jgi:hypothetical protein
MLALHRRSIGWSPLGKLVRVLRPPIYQAADFQPLEGAEGVSGAPEGTWRVTGPKAALLLPVQLSPGWVHLRLRVRADAGGLANLYIHTSEGIRHLETLRLGGNHLVLSVERYYRWSEEIRGLRLHPLDRAGSVIIEKLWFKPVPQPRMFFRLVKKSWKKVRSRGGVLRVGLRALGLLVRGRFGQLNERLARQTPQKTRLETAPLAGAGPDATARHSA